MLNFVSDYDSVHDTKKGKAKQILVKWQVRKEQKEIKKKNQNLLSLESQFDWGVHQWKPGVRLSSVQPETV